MEKRGKKVGELAVLLLVLNYINIFRTILEKRGKEVGALAVLILALNLIYRTKLEKRGKEAGALAVLPTSSPELIYI